MSQLELFRRKNSEILKMISDLKISPWTSKTGLGITKGKRDGYYVGLTFKPRVIKGDSNTSKKLKLTL
jgi:hypothetical protein